MFLRLFMFEIRSIVQEEQFVPVNRSLMVYRFYKINNICIF